MAQTIPNTTYVREHVDTLTAMLAGWALREQAKGGEARAMAACAMDSIDHATAALWRVRSDLTAQIREYDDATAVRVDKLLAEGGAR